MTYILYDTALNGQYSLLLLQGAYPVNQSLFHGTKDEALSDVAPYLFQVDEQLLMKITDPLLSLQAIIVVQAEEKFEKVAFHFREFIYEKKNGRENYFRFWDARVLERYLPASSAESLDAFFEGIESFCSIDQQSNAAKKFFLKRGKLQQAELPLAELFALGYDVTAVDESSNTSNTSETKPKRKFFYD